jgi:GT2 family glycosyltransferase
VESDSPAADRMNHSPTVDLAPSLPMSVVLATYNRVGLLEHVLDCLSRQTLPPGHFEVIVVDDGSEEPASIRIDSRRYPYTLTIIRQKNAGPAAARHRGVLEAQGRILVLIDDDMDLPARFLETHLAYHDAVARPRAVFGRYASDPDIAQKPLFERYHGLKWDQLSAGIASGQVRVDGTLLATGNTSMRREDYFRTGGLDFTLPRAEDMALGLDLEEIGVEFVFSDDAYSVHLSDHIRSEKWRGRAYLHGQLEPRIARKHPMLAHADPWRFAFSLPLWGRVLCLPAMLSPWLGERVADAVLKGAEMVDALGFERPAMRGAGLVFGMEYFRGMRAEAGSVVAMVGGCVRFLKKVAISDRPVQGVPPWLARAVRSVTKG